MKKRVWILGILMAAIIGLMVFRSFENQGENAQELYTGITMGVVPYSIKVIGSGACECQTGIDSLLEAFNQSLSTYIPDSEISTFNREDSLGFQTGFFYPILKASQKVVEETYGAFDPTVGPLVNAWGFGPDKQPALLDSAYVDSLLSKVGFSRVAFDEVRVMKEEGMYLDFSAIAKGYAVDLVAQYLTDMGVVNYLIEIGGEVRVQGLNEKGEPWTIGIEDPRVEKNERSLLAAIPLRNRSLATSGNYRNYYEREGQLVAHIIDPRSGYNNFNKILSASVFASNCMEADAYATAFMVLGVDSSLEIVKKNADLEAIFFYQENGEFKSYASPGISDQLTLWE